MNLPQKIKNKQSKVAIIGLGYVGLPLAVEFKCAGFQVIGIDTNEKRVENVNKKKSYIEDVPDHILRKCKIIAYTDYEKLKEADVIIICVPTPLRKTKDPDVSYVLESARQIASHMVKPQLVVLESTTYPGTTEELILPVLSRGHRQVGKDFCLAYSPERVDPGNKKYTTSKIPKVIAGITPSCLSMIGLLYKKVFKKVIPVSSPKVAETVKLLENTFRTVNIALVDEIAIMCHRMNIDVWEVIKAAGTKPFGYMPFYPGPGVGGACLPKDPLYLAWRAQREHFKSRFIELASDITTSMPSYVVGRLTEILKKPLTASSVLILGVAYKKDIGDTRDSPSIEIIKLLKQNGVNIVYNDPYVPQITIDNMKYKSVKLNNKILSSADAVLITTAHSSYDYKRIIKYAKLVFDSRGETWGLSGAVRL